MKENITPTIKPAPERTTDIGGWKVEELENERGYHIITPQGYIFGLASKGLVLAFIADISFTGLTHITMYGDSHEVRDGRVYSWSSDPWVNPGIEHGDTIALVSHLTDVVMKYVRTEWIK